MSLEGFQLCRSASRSDARRDAQIPLPEGVTEFRNIQYGPYGEYSLLDVYYPENATAPLPTIVSIHGGGYVYGSKEELGHSIGREMRASLAVTDAGLAKSLIGHLEAVGNKEAIV